MELEDEAPMPLEFVVPGLAAVRPYHIWNAIEASRKYLLSLEKRNGFFAEDR